MPMLFVEADEPLLVFPSIEVAETYLEAVDIQDNVYPRAYGPAGEMYDIVARGDLVVIEPSAMSPRPNDLKRLLSSYLGSVGEPVSGDADLATLVASVEAHQNAFWVEHDPDGERFSKPIPLWGCIAVIVALIGMSLLLWRLR
ncbi:hypothetical protein ASE75_00620 [Sphingomonas sp. Leaf17]|uniref:hypothetical protein n=1 Tax=Sphingomonas sp. Leaf17 TaxID=1735683 RepID=UPI0006F6004D|nr:hypothetical protein [Sphingomonas sp. Leaf17]KQM67494.1 hypothetical protein ASE75_00620 [Sphingomonas sp. Leaf17]